MEEVNSADFKLYMILNVCVQNFKLHVSAFKQYVVIVGCLIYGVLLLRRPHMRHVVDNFL